MLYVENGQEFFEDLISSEDEFLVGDESSDDEPQKEHAKRSHKESAKDSNLNEDGAYDDVDIVSDSETE